MDEKTKTILIGLIKEFEGCRLTAYPDPATGGDPWTIGYGQTGDGIKKGVVWTQKQADDALAVAMVKYWQQAVNASPNLAKATPPRQAAIVDFCYNCGIGNYKKSSLIKDVIAENWHGASLNILKWDKAAGKVMKGLTRRRQAESKLLL